MNSNITKRLKYSFLQIKNKIKISNYDLSAIVFCFILFTISLILGYYHKIGTFGVETDFYGAYGIQANNILSGKSYTYQVNPPGYPILVAFTSLITKDFFVAGKILSAFSMILLLGISYLIFKKLFSEKTAFVSTIFFGTILIPYSFLAATDLVGAAFATIPIYILINKKENKNYNYLLTGIACGAAYLIRLESVFVPLGITLSLLFVINHSTWKIKFIKTGILLIGFLIITSPWLLYNWKLNGSPLATGAYDQIGYHLYNWKENDNNGSEGSENEQMVEQIIENSKSPGVLLIKPLQLFLNYLKNTPSRVKSFMLNGLPFPLYFFIGGGIILFFKNLNRKRLAYLIIWSSGFLIMGFISYKIRHYFVLIPFTSLLVAYLFFYFFTGSASIKENIFVWLLIILSTFFLIKKSSKDINHLFDSEPKYLIKAAEFLSSRSSENNIVIARKPHLPYLAGLKCIFLYEYSEEDFYLKSKQLEARYLVYSDVEADLWEGLRVFNDPDNVKDKFKLIYKDKPSNTLIYEIK